MAVSLPRNCLAVELRLAATREAAADLPQGQGEILDRLLVAATSLVEAYAPAAPEAAQNEAVIRVASFLFDRSGSEGRGGNPMLQSGAAFLLAPFRERMVKVAGAARAAAPAGTAPAGALNTDAVLALLADALVPGAHVSIKRKGDTFVIATDGNVAVTDATAREAAAAARALAATASTTATEADDMARAAATFASAAATKATANATAITKLPRVTVSAANPNTTAPAGQARNDDLHVQVTAAAVKFYHYVGGGTWNVSATFTAPAGEPAAPSGGIAATVVHSQVFTGNGAGGSFTTTSRVTQSVGYTLPAGRMLQFRTRRATGGAAEVSWKSPLLLSDTIRGFGASSTGATVLNDDHAYQSATVAKFAGARVRIGRDSGYGVLLSFDTGRNQSLRFDVLEVG